MPHLKTILTLSALLSVWLGSPQWGQAKARVFLLGGQSNMAGHGDGDKLVGPLASYQGPQKNVKIWHSYQDLRGPGSSNAWIPLAPGFGDFYAHRTNPRWADREPSFGPEVSFGRAMAQAFPKDDIYLIKHAWGASSLGGGWSPVAGKKSGVMTGGKGTPGLQYNLFTRAVKAALANLDKANIDYEIAGMLWMQGETDAQSKYGGRDKDYDKNLAAFIADMRMNYGKDLPFVIGRINNHGQWNGTNTRTAQQVVAEKTEGVYWFDTDDIQRSGNGHYTTAGQIELGRRFAKVFLPTTKSSPQGQRKE